MSPATFAANSIWRSFRSIAAINRFVIVTVRRDLWSCSVLHIFRFRACARCCFFLARWSPNSPPPSPTQIYKKESSRRQALCRASIKITNTKWVILTTRSLIRAITGDVRNRPKLSCHTVWRATKYYLGHSPIP